MKAPTDKFAPTDATARRLAGKWHPFCGFECWSEYVTTVVAADYDRDEPTCPTCGADK